MFILHQCINSPLAQIVGKRQVFCCLGYEIKEQGRIQHILLKSLCYYIYIVRIAYTWG